MSEVNLSFEKPFQNASSVEQLEMVAEVGGEKLEAMKQQVAELLRALRRRAYEIDRQKIDFKGAFNLPGYQESVEEVDELWEMIEHIESSLEQVKSLSIERQIITLQSIIEGISA